MGNTGRMDNEGHRPLPLPVRVAAGLVASAVEQARDLPRLAVEFPVTAVSQALQASMRVQQKITELAIKGDRALGALRPVEEKPSWATFDEDEPPRRNGRSAVTELRPHGRPESEPDPTPESAPTSAEVAAEVTAQAAVDTAELAPTDENLPTAPVPGPDLAGPAEVGAPVVGGSGPNALPGYDVLTIPQLRARLRRLSAADLRALLDWETAHENRPAYVTMLTNRITMVSET